MLTLLPNSDNWSRILIIANIILLLLLWLFCAQRFWLSVDFIPLHYTVYFGFDRFGPKYDIFLFPTLATMIVGANFSVVKWILGNKHLWRKILLGLTLLMQITLFLSLILVVLKDLY